MPQRGDGTRELAPAAPRGTRERGPYGNRAFIAPVLLTARSGLVVSESGDGHRKTEHEYSECVHAQFEREKILAAPT